MAEVGLEEALAVAAVLVPVEGLPAEEVMVVVLLAAADMVVVGMGAGQLSQLELELAMQARRPTHPIPSPTSQPLVVNVVLQSMSAT